MTVKKEDSVGLAKESQYDSVIRNFGRRGPVRLGMHTSHFWREDPKRLGFMLARYKFVAKMLSGCGDVLEIGCGDGFGAEVVLQEVGRVHCVDFDPIFIEHCKKERSDKRLTFGVADLAKKPVSPPREAAYALDVLEHIPKKDERQFLKNIVRSLKDSGICIIGMPSLQSQRYASSWSKKGHVNCKSGTDLKALLQKYFEHVFLFGMNDEVIHTGFLPMAHYLIAVCCRTKRG